MPVCGKFVSPLGREPAVFIANTRGDSDPIARMGLPPIRSVSFSEPGGDGRAQSMLAPRRCRVLPLGRPLARLGSASNFSPVNPVSGLSC